jgi:hypothetical protein
MPIFSVNWGFLIKHAFIKSLFIFPVLLSIWLTFPENMPGYSGLAGFIGVM